jgi:hypothetical protein
MGIDHLKFSASFQDLGSPKGADGL